jgi:predicted transcriptional regulator
MKRLSEIQMARSRKTYPRKVTHAQSCNYLAQDIEEKCQKSLERIRTTYNTLDGIEQSIFKCLFAQGSASSSRVAEYVDGKRTHVETVLEKLRDNDIVEYDEEANSYSIKRRATDCKKIIDAIQEKEETLGATVKSYKPSVISKLLF